MIILFEENEKSFTSLGIGVLKDAKTCVVKEELNDSFELELTYPIDGLLYNKIKIGRILLTKVSPYSEEEPFRISYISKPINGLVTINAVHVSYDMNGIPVEPISGTSLKDTLDKIQNGTLIPHNFNLYTDKPDTKSFTTHNYYNMRALLVGTDNSVLDQYKGDVLFNKFNVYLLQRRGENRGAQVRYAKNMKDITHEINYDKLYNKVYPFYHKETSSQTSSSEEGEFKKVYVVGSKPYQDGWLSYSEGGEPYHPVDESPVQVVTDGNFYQKVYTWDTITQRYRERVYNETVTLIDGLGNLLSSENTPSWIYIDWSKIPRIIVKANQEGYFKTVTDTNWSPKKKKGDVILDASVTEVGSNLIMYYSEVIPTSSATLNEDTTQVTHIELKNKIIDIETEAAKEMLYDRVLMLDLSSEFDEAPTEEQLELKAKEYIDENKIGQYKYNTSVSFIDLSSTTEGAEYKNFEKIELGDSVEVVYEDLGVDIQLRVVSTEYNVLLDRYNKINLGETPEKISGESVQYGDDISSLTNDAGYADVNTVNKLIAKQITADLIEAKNAKLSKAQIEELQSARIKCTGIIEASQFELDTLVAKMLTADNAVIKQTLEAGTVKVKGDITVTQGQITIQSTADDGSSIVFRVDRNGNVEANSVKIFGGELNINDIFVVTPDGIMTAMGASISGDVVITSGSITLGSKFKVDPDGTMYASNATISGDISATTGHIAGFVIESDRLHDSDNKIILSPGYLLSVDSIYKSWTILSGVDIDTSSQLPVYSAKFKVADDGSMYASEANVSGSINITSGSISITNGTTSAFIVNDEGHVIANSVAITGGSLTIGNKFSVTQAGILTASEANISGNITITSGEITITDGFNSVFHVDQYGRLDASAVNITGGSLSISGYNASVYIGSNGTLTANNAVISGNITAAEGNIGGFTITNKGLYYGFTPSTTVHAQGYGVYIGPDAIRLGNDVSRNYYYPSSSTSEPVNGSSIVTATLFDITDPSNPTDCYNGARFKVRASTTKSGDRKYIFVPCKSASISDPDFTSEEISCTIPAYNREAYVTLDTKYPVIDSNGQKHAYYAVYEQNSLGGAIRLTLDMLGGFTVTSDGMVTMYNAQVKGSFYGDVRITGGSLSISNGSTTSFSVTEAGVMTATGATITGNLTSNNVSITGGTIGGLSVSTDSLSYGSALFIKASSESGDPRSPNYQIFANSMFTNKMILSLETSAYDEDFWLEFRKRATPSTTIRAAGLFYMFSNVSQPSEPHGFIPTRAFGDIPWFTSYINSSGRQSTGLNVNPVFCMATHTFTSASGTYDIQPYKCKHIYSAFVTSINTLGFTGCVIDNNASGGPKVTVTVNAVSSPTIHVLIIMQQDNEYYYN